MTNKLHRIPPAIRKALRTPGTETPAWLGDAYNNVIAVDPSTNEVYVTLDNGQVIKVINRCLPNDFLYPVMIGTLAEDPNTLQVLRARDTYLSIPGRIPDHSRRHQWPYPDTTYIRPEQFMGGGLPLSMGDMNVKLFGKRFHLNGFKFLNDTIVDFTSLIPVSGAKWCAVEVDETGTLSYTLGTEQPDRHMLEESNLPALSSSKHFLYAVKLYFGQTRIVQNVAETDIFDPRFTGYASGGATGDMQKVEYDPNNIAAPPYAIVSSTEPVAQFEGQFWIDISGDADESFIIGGVI